MPPQLPHPALCILLPLNVLAFCLYWWDKQAAINGRRRIRESTLLGLALVGGSLGAVAAQKILRHKTRKEPFRSRLLLIVALHLILGAAWVIGPDHIRDAANAMAQRI